MFRPPPVQVLATSRANTELTGLRGFAALFVVWHHALVFRYLLDPGYMPRGALAYGPPGHFQVLVFFVLSGYVIGLTNQQPLTRKTGWLYLKKRLVRLYPIFLLTTGLTILITTEPYSLTTIMGNIFMLQGTVVPDINLIAWTIPYEVFYYLLFSILSYFRLNSYVIMLGAFLVAALNCAFYAVTQVASITSYSYGLLFWLVGLCLSRVLAARTPQAMPSRLLLSGVFLLLSIAFFNLFDTLLHRWLPQLAFSVTLPAELPWDKVAVTVFDLATILPTVLLVSLFSGKQIPYKPWLAKGLVLFAAIQWVFVLVHIQRGEASADYYTLPTLFLVCAILCAFIRSVWLDYLSAAVMQAGSWLGTLSYGIYLVHYPLLLGFSRVKLVAGSRSTFALRFVLLLALVLLLGYVLERVIQPRLKACFIRPSELAPAVPTPLASCKSLK